MTNFSVSDAEIDEVVRLRGEGKSQNQIAKMLGVTRNVVRWRLDAAAHVESSGKSRSTYKLGGDPKDRRIVALADEVKRLKREIELQHRSSIDEDEVRDIIGTLSIAPCEPPKWLVGARRARSGISTPEVPATSWADWHVGEVVKPSEVNGVNEYNLAIMEKRVRRLVERTIRLSQEHGPGNYPGIVINLIGDMVSGWLHDELIETDEETPLQCALRVRDLLVWALQAMADEFGHVYAPAVCGNHGRMTARPQFKALVYKNYDWLIYEMVKRALKDRKDDRIQIDVRPANEVFYRIWDVAYLAAHGDMLGVKGGDGIIGSIGPITRGEIKTRGRTSSSGMPFDMLVIGHWHQPLWLPRTIVANTLKGFCQFAKNALSATPTPASQPLWFNHPRYGITSRWEVKLEPAIAKDKTEWVSVFDPVAKAA
jgi:transposase-like protein